VFLRPSRAEEIPYGQQFLPEPAKGKRLVLPVVGKVLHLALFQMPLGPGYGGALLVKEALDFQNRLDVLFPVQTPSGAGSGWPDLDKLCLPAERRKRGILIIKVLLRISCRKPGRFSV
jgi:hypothetical protein